VRVNKGDLDEKVMGCSLDTVKQPSMLSRIKRIGRGVVRPTRIWADKDGARGTESAGVS